jgi:hypothetical protein
MTYIYCWIIQGITIEHQNWSQILHHDLELLPPIIGSV